MRIPCLALFLLSAAVAVARPETAAPMRVAPKGQWLSKTFAVEPLARYRLTFRARVAGGLTRETGAEAEEAFYDVRRVQRGVLWPRWERRFFASDGTRAKDWGILYPYWNSVWSAKNQDFVDVFYAPPGAATLQVVYANPGADTTLWATEPSLVREDGGPALNVNSDFALGRYCHAGYAMAGYGSSVQMLPKPEGGGFFLRVATWCNMDPVPVVAGTRYRVALALRPDTFSGARSTVTFEGDDGKPIKNSGGSVLAKKAAHGGEETFRAPPGATRMKMLIGAADYAAIRVEAAGEERTR